MRDEAQPGVRADAPARGSSFASVSAARRSTGTLERMNLACPHCGSRTISVGRELITGSLRSLECSACGNRSYIKNDLRNALLGFAFFAAALALSYAVGGREIYNLNMATRFPALSWGLAFTFLALVAYLAFAFARPLKRAGVGGKR